MRIYRDPRAEATQPKEWSRSDGFPMRRRENNHFAGVELFMSAGIEEVKCVGAMATPG